MDIKINILLSLFLAVLTFAFGISLEGVGYNLSFIFSVIVFVSFLFINSEFLSKIAEERKERRLIENERIDREVDEEWRAREIARAEEEGRLEAREEHRRRKREGYW